MFFIKHVQDSVSTKTFNVKQKMRYSRNLASGTTINNNLAREGSGLYVTFSFGCRNYACFPAGIQ